MQEPAAPTIEKSAGITETERLLASYCERTFLKLWSYPNPCREDGHELCDLLAVFGGTVFVFFDRASTLAPGRDQIPEVSWERWRKRVVDRQVKTAHGAERYIRSGRPIFLDAKGAMPFPLPIDPTNAVVHKIIVAHGAKEACERASSSNVYGSLAISYVEPKGDPVPPFHIQIDRHKPVHVFDSHNLPIILAELDTVTDLAAYLAEKERAVATYGLLGYCGEEDLLAHYLLNYDKAGNRHVIGPRQSDDRFDFVMIGEGEWHDFVGSGVYSNTKAENGVSYFWDELIQRTCQNLLDGTLGGNADLLRGQSAIFEMVKEPRFVRRELAQQLLSACGRFPTHMGEFSRQVTLLPSFDPKTAYVFLQLRTPSSYRAEPEYREKRRAVLEIACGAAKNKFPEFTKIVGIGIDAPKFFDGADGEDFILLPCGTWTDEMRAHYDERNVDWNFFGTPNLRKHETRATRFVHPKKRVSSKNFSKVGRNDPCPCGSGKKSKKCHGAP